jgi:hypothetical protein
MKTRRFSDLQVRRITHALVWALVILLPFILNSREGAGHPAEDRDSNDFLYINAVSNIIWIGLFYLNAGWMVPRFIYRGRWLAFGLLALLGFGIFLLLHSLPVHPCNQYHLCGHPGKKPAGIPCPGSPPGKPPHGIVLSAFPGQPSFPV